MYPALNVPKSWDSLEELADWYIQAGFPMLPPRDFQTFRTDDAVAICTLRVPPYQVELYIVDDPLSVPIHEHPFVEVIQYVFDRDQAPNGVALPKQLGTKLMQGMSHGAADPAARESDSNGVIYVFEKWPEGVMPSTISAVWKGGVVGPRHEALIRRFFPDAYIRNGVADIMRNN